jgi:hypothetical protein
VSIRGARGEYEFSILWIAGALGARTLNTATVGAVSRTSVGYFFKGSIDEATYFAWALDAATISHEAYVATH